MLTKHTPLDKRAACHYPHIVIAGPFCCCHLHGEEGIRLCMDPFLGIGASAVAAARLRISFTGFELDEGYFAEAVERVETQACRTRAGGAPTGSRDDGEALATAPILP